MIQKPNKISIFRVIIYNIKQLKFYTFRGKIVTNNRKLIFDIIILICISFLF